MTSFATTTLGALGVAATLTIPAPGAGRRLVLRSFSASASDSSGPITSVTLQISDGISTFIQRRTRTGAANEQWSIDMSDLKIVAAENAALTLSFTGAAANTGQAISAAGFVI